MEVTERVREFILEDLGWDGSDRELTDEYPLIEKRVLDSLAIVQVVTMLEEEFDTEIDDDELVAENFATLTAIERLVESKR